VGDIDKTFARRGRC